MIGKPKTEQVPAIGRMVHYVANGEHVCAFVTRVHVDDPDTVDLKCFGLHDDFRMYGVQHDERGISATWHWPEYVPARPVAE